jgi:hypothetical protein
MKENGWPPKGYVFKFNPKSYHNDPAQQHGSIAEDQLRKETISRLKTKKVKKVIDFGARLCYHIFIS